MAQEQKRNDGGIWESKDKNGNIYFYGTIEINGTPTKFKAFKNTFKQPGERTPDFRIMLDEANVPVKTQAPVKAKKVVVEEEDDSIPF